MAPTLSFIFLKTNFMSFMTQFHIKFTICNEEWITKLMKPLLYNLDFNFYLSWNDKG
jgi:hypothetical protein